MMHTDSLGVLELGNNGAGFLRRADRSYLPSRDDVHVPARTVRELDLRPGDEISGENDYVGVFSEGQIDSVASQAQGVFIANVQVRQDGDFVAAQALRPTFEADGSAFDDQSVCGKKAAIDEESCRGQSGGP